MPVLAYTPIPDDSLPLPPYFLEGKTSEWAQTLVVAGLHPSWYGDPEGAGFHPRSSLECARRQDGILQDTRAQLHGIVPAIRLRGPLPTLQLLRSLINLGGMWAQAGGLPQPREMELASRSTLNTVHATALERAIRAGDTGALGAAGASLFHRSAQEALAADCYFQILGRSSCKNADWVDDLSVSAMALAAATRMDMLEQLGAGGIGRVLAAFTPAA